jgi:hypothetical protein
MAEKIRLAKSDLHVHLEARMNERGIGKGEIEATLSKGWEAAAAKAGTLGKTLVFPYNKDWAGQLCEEKEVTVYYKAVKGRIILLTAMAKYGKDFAKGGTK